MKKISQKELDRIRQKTKVTIKKPAPAKQQEVPMASMSAAIQKIGDENKKVIKEFADDVKKIVGRKRKPWKFTVNRDGQGSITTVLADPIDEV